MDSMGFGSSALMEWNAGTIFMIILVLFLFFLIWRAWKTGKKNQANYLTKITFLREEEPPKSESEIREKLGEEPPLIGGNFLAAIGIVGLGLCILMAVLLSTPSKKDLQESRRYRQEAQINGDIKPRWFFTVEDKQNKINALLLGEIKDLQKNKATKEEVSDQWKALHSLNEKVDGLNTNLGDLRQELNRGFSNMANQVLGTQENSGDLSPQKLPQELTKKYFWSNQGIDPPLPEWATKKIKEHDLSLNELKKELTEVKSSLDSDRKSRLEIDKQTLFALTALGQKIGKVEEKLATPKANPGDLIFSGEGYSIRSGEAGGIIVTIKSKLSAKYGFLPWDKKYRFAIYSVELWSPKEISSSKIAEEGMEILEKFNRGQGGKHYVPRMIKGKMEPHDFAALQKDLAETASDHIKETEWMQKASVHPVGGTITLNEKEAREVAPPKSLPNPPASE